MIKDDTGQGFIQTLLRAGMQNFTAAEVAHFLVQSFIVSLLYRGKASWENSFTGQPSLLRFIMLRTRLRFHNIFIRKSRQR